VLAVVGAGTLVYRDGEFESSDADAEAVRGLVVVEAAHDFDDAVFVVVETVVVVVVEVVHDLDDAVVVVAGAVVVVEVAHDLDDAVVDTSLSVVVCGTALLVCATGSLLTVAKEVLLLFQPDHSPERRYGCRVMVVQVVQVVIVQIRCCRTSV